jgi:hypothetical protein
MKHVMAESMRCGMGAIAGTLLLTLIGTQSAAAAPEDNCFAQLAIGITPDGPDASDVGFLSSLVYIHPGYRLELLQQIDPSLVELGLSGPGPGYRCLNVVDTIGNDPRVLSIRIISDDSQSTPTTSIPASAPELWGVPVSASGIGSLYWAARHTGHAWKVLLPAVE